MSLVLFGCRNQGLCDVGPDKARARYCLALLSAIKKICDCVFASATYIVSYHDVLAIRGYYIVFRPFRSILRIIAAVFKAIIFDANVDSRRDEYRALRYVYKAVVVYVYILVHACRIVKGISVVTGLKDDRTLICTAFYMSTIFYYVISYLDVAARTNLPPDAYIGRKKQSCK